MYKAYKLVERTDCPEVFESCVAIGKYTVQYRKNEIIKAPEGTKLFVFENFPTRSQLDAVVSISSSRYVLFEVATDELANATECTRILYSETDISDFWAKKRCACRVPTITNTAFCNSIVLLKEVALPPSAII